MAPQAARLEREILVLFKQACRCNRTDIAEHLLRAIEASSGKDASARRTDTVLAEAYREIARSLSSASRGHSPSRE